MESEEGLCPEREAAGGIVVVVGHASTALVLDPAATGIKIAEPARLAG